MHTLNQIASLSSAAVLVFSPLLRADTIEGVPVTVLAQTSVTIALKQARDAFRSWIQSL